MKEIALTKLEAYYKEKIQFRFKKEHKVLERLFLAAKKEIGETINSLKGWNEPRVKKTKNAADIEPIDDKNQKVMERFVEHINEVFNEFKIPFAQTEFSYNAAIDFRDHVKKTYIAYNEQGKKSIPKFIKQYNLEVKELDLHLRNLGDISQKIMAFLRNNYQEGKTAEAVLERIPRLATMIDRLGSTKCQIETMEKEFAESEKNLKDLEESLYVLGQDPDLIAYEDAERDEQHKELEIQDLLKFKKAFKKLKALIDKGDLSTHGITDIEIRPYLKNPVETIIGQGAKMNQLKDLLLKLRNMIEDEDDPLQLKGELKPKILANIHEIVNENLLEPYIADINELRTKKASLKQELIAKGLENQRNDLKEKIANLTIQNEHDQNDLNRRKREYRELIERVAADREDLQKNIKNFAGEDIKISVIIPD